MRIAIVINTSWNIFNYRRGLIKALQEKGCKVLAIAPKDHFSDKLTELGCEFTEISMDNKGVNPLKDFILFKNLLSVYKRCKPDFVLHYTIKPNTYGSLACGILGIPCISNVSGLGTVFIRKGWIYFLVKLLYRVALSIPERVFFQNKEDKQLFTDLNILSRKKAGLLPGSGINTSDFVPLSYQKHAPFRFLLIARLLQDKGIAEYAHAARILKEKGFKAECLLVGFYDRESAFNIPEKDINLWSEKGYIRFLGESNRIADQVNEADCVVLPSYREGTPRSLLEAMALCKPVIATDVPGCREVLQEGENGYFCVPQSSESLADSMIRMMELPEDSLREMGRKGRILAETKFDEKIVIQSYLNEIFGKNVS